MIDSHAHIISEFYDNIENLILKEKEKGIIKIINCGDNVFNSKEVIKLSQKYNEILLPTVGIHPGSKDDFDKVDEIENLILNNKVYAIGEIGLDYYWDKENKEEQKKILNEQLDLAEKYNLPIIIHSRDSIQDCYDILKNRNLKGVIHCFNGSKEMAHKFVELGYKLGIGGVLTFKNSKTYELIKDIDLKNILLETDSPFLTPEPYRGKKNRPSNVYYVAKKIAEIKNISIEEVIRITTNNAISLFDI